MDGSIRQAQTTVKQLVANHPYFNAWTFSTCVLQLKSENAAEIECDYELRKARIRIDPEWQTKTPGTLDELVAHELGHAMIGDVFEFFRGHLAEAVEERLASRIGLFLLGGNNANSTDQRT